MGPAKNTKYSRTNLDRTVDWIDETDPENIKVKRLPGRVASVTQVNFGINKLKRAGMPKKKLREFKQAMWAEHAKKLEGLLKQLEKAKK